MSFKSGRHCEACNGTGKKPDCEGTTDEDWAETLIECAEVLTVKLRSSLAELAEQGRILPVTRYELSALRQALEDAGY